MCANRFAAHLRFVCSALLFLLLALPEICLAPVLAGTFARSGEPDKKTEKAEPKEEKSEARNKPEKSAPAEATTDEKSPVVLAGQVSEDSAGPHGIIRFWLTVDNRSSSSLTNIQLTQPQVPGFRLTRLCWPGLAGNRCVDVPQDSDASSVDHEQLSATRHTLQDTLAPDESVSVWGYLEAVHVEPKQNAFLTVSWDGPGHSSKTIGLGDIESLSRLRALFLLFSNRWEWSFPVAIAIVSYLGGLWVKRREKKRKAKAEQLSYQQRTWTLMLKQAQSVGIKYYTPMSGSLLALRNELEQYLADKKNSAILAEACYDLLMFQRRLRSAQDNVGGYYFKNRQGESFADLLFQKHRALLNFDASLRTKFSAASLGMKLDTTWAEFSQAMHSPASAIHSFWLAFQPHMATLADDTLNRELRVLDAYSGLLQYEVNRPLLYWYGKLQPIEFKYKDAQPSRDVLLEWKSWKKLLQLSDTEIAQREDWGREYLQGAEKEIVVEVAEKTLVQRAKDLFKKTWQFLAGSTPAATPNP